MERYKNKYQIDSTRLRNWDYAWQGIYYVTICTLDKENYFGEIIEGEMVLNKLGQFAHKEWYRTPEIRPDMNIRLGEFVVMPNHIHGIISIGSNQYNAYSEKEKHGRDAMPCVSKRNNFGPQRKNLSSVIRGYKASVTSYARKNDIIFGWQARFNDRIIDDMLGLVKCEKYIQNNPINWQYEDPTMPITIIEIKARSTQHEKVREILKESGAEFKGKDHQIDTYFNVGNGRLKLREGTIENNLIHYERPDQKGPKQSSVLLYKSMPDSSLKSLLAKANGILVIVDKQREIYFIDNIKFHIDVVKNLGTFIEIEAIDETGEIGREKLLEQCRQYLDLFDVREEELVDRSYSDLLIEKCDA